MTWWDIRCMEYLDFAFSGNFWGRSWGRGRCWFKDMCSFFLVRLVFKWSKVFGQTSCYINFFKRLTFKNPANSCCTEWCATAYIPINERLKPEKITFWALENTKSCSQYFRKNVMKFTGNVTMCNSYVLRVFMLVRSSL